jgi:hypothetical protein
MYRLFYREKHISPLHIVYGARLFLNANIWISLNGLAFVTKIQLFLLILQYYLDMLRVTTFIKAWIMHFLSLPLQTQKAVRAFVTVP